MTSDEMIEGIKRIRRECGEMDGVAVDFSIEPLLRSHPEQLDDFIDKYADLMAEEIAQKSGAPKDELRDEIAEHYRKFFRNREEQ